MLARCMIQMSRVSPAISTASGRAAIMKTTTDAAALATSADSEEQRVANATALQMPAKARTPGQETAIKNAESSRDLFPP